MKNNSQKYYKSMFKNYFTLNPIKLLDLEPIHIQNFYDILLADDLRPTTVIRYHAIIRNHVIMLLNKI